MIVDENIVKELKAFIFGFEIKETTDRHILITQDMGTMSLRDIEIVENILNADFVHSEPYFWLFRWRD